METSLIISSISAIGVTAAAVASWRAAKSERLSSQGILFNDLFTAYHDLRSSFYILRSWREKNNDDIDTTVSVWFSALNNKDDDLYEEAKKIHEARRKVVYHFIRCWRLKRAGLMSKYLYNTLVNKRTAELFIKVAIPLTRRLGTGDASDKFILEDVIKRLKINPEDKLGDPPKPQLKE